MLVDQVLVQPPLKALSPHKLCNEQSPTNWSSPSNTKVSTGYFSSRFSMKKCRCTEITWVKKNNNSLEINLNIKQSFPKSLCNLETFRMEGFIHFLCHQRLCQQSRKKTQT